MPSAGRTHEAVQGTKGGGSAYTIIIHGAPVTIAVGRRRGSSGRRLVVRLPAPSDYNQGINSGAALFLFRLANGRIAASGAIEEVFRLGVA